MSGRRAQRCEIFQIRAGQSALAVNISAQESGAEGLESAHNALRAQRDKFAPTVSCDSATIRIECNDDLAAGNGAYEPTKKAEIDFAAMEGGAANDDLAGAEFYQLFGADDRSNAAADPDLQFVFVVRALAEGLNESIFVIFTHGRVQIDDVQPSV